MRLDFLFTFWFDLMETGSVKVNGTGLVRFLEFEIEIGPNCYALSGHQVGEMGMGRFG